MSVRTIELNETRVPRDPRGIVAYAGAAAFAVAAVWYGLAVNGVTLAAAPDVGPRVAPGRALHLHYDWFVTTLPQERLYTGVAIAGFGCLAAIAIFLRDVLNRDRVIARTGTLAIVAGAVLWMAGSVAQLGGHQAVGQMATHANPIQAVSSIAFTVDMVANAIALAAFTLLGVGMLLLVADAARKLPAQRGWAGCSLIVALAMLVTAASYAADASGLTNFMLLLSGVVLLPVWLVTTRSSLAGLSSDESSAV
jgi:hypothetical protein